MSRTKSLFLIAGAGLSVSVSALAQTNSNLDQSRAIAGDLMADASSRTSQLAPADKQFSMNVGGYIQFRNQWNHNDDNAVDKDMADGFSLARTRINVGGNVLNEDLSYFIQFGWDADGNEILEDAYGDYKFGNGWDIKWGQFKAPFMREELVGDTYQLAADRSQYWNTFTLGRTQGVMLGFEGKDIRFAFSWNDGATSGGLQNLGAGGAQNSDFISSGEADFAADARLEYKWAGDWKQAVDFTSFQQSPFFGMVGVAGHYQTGGDTFAAPYPNGTTADVDLWAITGDVSLEGDGWNVFASLVYSHIEPSNQDSTDNFGFDVQGGFFVAPQWEIFGRFDSIMPDSGFSPNDNTFSTITVGVNRYFIRDSHAAKWTADFQYFLDNPSETAIVAPNTLTGLLQSNSDAEWNIRVQMQLVF